MEMRRRGLAVRNPELTFATPDHAVASSPGRTGATFPPGERLWAGLKTLSEASDIRFFDLGRPGQGIVHVMAPELGLVLPGLTLICGDSHSCTNGGLGALAFGVGSSESTHALATQTLRQRKPKRMRIRLDSTLGPGVTAKDLILHIIGRLGAAAGVEHAIEFAGSAVRAMNVEGRLTICNLAVELGAKSGLVAPDDMVFAYLQDRPFAPKGAHFAIAIDHWRRLTSDKDAVFDRDTAIDVSAVAPTVTWGTSPEQAMPVDGLIPDPAAAEPAERAGMIAALDYMGLEPGRPIAGTRIDWVFIGSCANSRIGDLRAAAAMLRDRHIADGVTAWVVPGSVAVKQQAETEGLDRVFRAAGFEWREPRLQPVRAANGERVPPGARAISTSNRNFVGRQGPGARTHLASPAMAAAAAIAGSIADTRRS